MWMSALGIFPDPYQGNLEVDACRERYPDHQGDLECP